MSRAAFRMVVVPVLGLALAGASGAQESRPGEGQAPLAAPSPAEEALRSAQRADRYLFILFWKEENTATQGVRQALDSALARRPGRADSILVKIGDPAEKALVDRFALGRSPMPMVLAVAPNGAITGGFPLKLSEEDVAAAFVSAGMAECLKAAQARKMVLLCVQPPGGAVLLPAGVSELKADARYGPALEVVTVRADDPAEASTLSVFKVTPKAGIVTTVLIGSSGRRIAAFEGAFTREQAIDKLKASKGECCPGGKC